VRIAQGFGERVLALRHDDEMHVVGHQAVRSYGEAVAIRVLAKEAEIGTAVAVGVEHVRTPVPPLGAVMGKPRYDDARNAAHRGRGYAIRQKKAN
jgi:hypothetical protein